MSLPLVRSEGLEPPRFYSLPPQGSASTNSATSAKGCGRRAKAGRINGADVTNRLSRYKTCDGPKLEVLQRLFRRLPASRQFRQHLLDFNRDAVAVDQHCAGGDRQVVGQHLDLVGLGGIQFDDGAAGQ